MDKIKILNPCIRCGRERVVVKTSKEKVGNSTITSFQTACPDKECQKIVDTILAKEKAHRDEIQSEFKKREAKRLKKVQLTRLNKARHLAASKFLQ